MRIRNPKTAPMVILGIALFFGWILGTPALGEPLGSRPVEKNPNPPVPINSDTISRLAEKMKRSVGNIRTTMVTQESPFPRGFRPPFGQQDPFRNFWEKFFGRDIPHEYRTRSVGSGVIIDPEGYILTNNHVVQNAKEIRITLYNEEDYQAKVVGRDPKTDLALIRIETGKELPAAPLGDWVVAIGLFEVLGTPALLRRLRGKQPLPHSEYVLRMIRFSGFIVLFLGLLFLLGFFRQTLYSSHPPF